MALGFDPFSARRAPSAHPVPSCTLHSPASPPIVCLCTHPWPPIVCLCTHPFGPQLCVCALTLGRLPCPPRWPQGPLRPAGPASRRTWPGPAAQPAAAAIGGAAGPAPLPAPLHMHITCAGLCVCTCARTRVLCKCARALCARGIYSLRAGRRAHCGAPPEHVSVCMGLSLSIVLQGMHPLFVRAAKFTTRCTTRTQGVSRATRAKVHAIQQGVCRVTLTRQVCEHSLDEARCCARQQGH